MNVCRYLFELPSFSPGDGGGGAGDGGAGGGSGAPPAPPPTPGGGGDGGNPSPAWTRPEGFPDRFSGESQEKFYADLTADWRAQREQISKLPQAAKAVDDYKFEPSEKAKSFVGDLGKDPIYDAARQSALKAGLPADQFSTFLGDLYDRLADGKMLAPPWDAQAERLAFLGKTGLNEEQAVAEIKPHLDRLGLFIDGFAQTQNLAPEAKAELGALLTTAHGMRALDAIVKAIGTPGINLGGDGDGGGMTKEQVNAMLRDPRADRDSAQYDREFAIKAQNAAKQMFG